MLDQDSTQQLVKKLAILEILRSLDKALTQTEIVEFVLRYDIMNYFELQQSMDELVSSQLVELTEHENATCCLVTEAGINAINLFSDRIPASFREGLRESIEEKRKEMSRKAIKEGVFVRLGDNDYQVKLKLQEGDRLLLSLEVNVFTADQARAMIENWNNNTTEVFTRLMAALGA